MYKLKPTQQLTNTKKVYGFDIETYDKNTKFYCASIYGDKTQETFYDKQELIETFKQPKFKHSIISATNLGFDFFGTFNDTEEINEFNTLFRGSDLITAHTHIHDNKFYRTNPIKNKNTILFIDTLNYAKQSVESIGKILGIPKLKKPECLGKLPNNKKERVEMEAYNMRDSEISKKYIDFLYNSFEVLGATPKRTIASTSMSLFKNKYLKQTFYTHKQASLLEQFKAYYGGRTEAFVRGKIKRYNYYDFNSLYPSVMLNEYPNPNTKRESRLNSMKYIDKYEGMSKVTIELDYLEKPLLPVIHEVNKQKKLVFPTGKWCGWYTHIELRKAISLGYIIHDIHKTIYFKETITPFKEYVTDLYNLRLEYKEQNNPMEGVVKLLMNSLYGKFGQKFLGKDNWIPLPKTLEELSKYKTFERIKNFIRTTTDNKPSAFCIPCFPSYVTAYGRIKLHEAILKSNAIYTDTDSLITKDEMPQNKKLGFLKLEDNIRNGIIIKPKFYGYKGNEGYKIVAKGIGNKLTFDSMIDIIKTKNVAYNKFMKFKEATRRGFIPNYATEINKNLVLEDNKRCWHEPFNIYTKQTSEPIRI